MSRDEEERKKNKKEGERGDVCPAPLLQDQQAESKPNGNRVWQISQVIV